MSIIKKFSVIVFFVSALLIAREFFNENKKQVELSTIKVEQEKIPQLPQKIEIAVPFTSQAPTGKWADVKQGNGCEEASLLMVYAWTTGLEVTPDKAVETIEDMSDFSLKLLGHFHDISNEDTIKLMKEYFKYEKIYLETEINLEKMKKMLAQEKALIIAVNGDILDNPNYQIPKPANHKIVVVGYDETTDEFITNDPGTSKGEKYRYGYEQLFDSITDYPTGYRESFDKEIKSAIVVEK